MFSVQLSPKVISLPSVSLRPKFSGSQNNLERINLFCMPKNFESKKEDFKKIINNLVIALNGMNKGIFFVTEDKEWGSKTKQAYLHIFQKTETKDIHFLQLSSSFYNENCLGYAKYLIASRTEKLKDPSLPEAVKKEVKALEELFDAIPRMEET